MLANTYGIAMPAKMDIECQILSKCVPQPSAVQGPDLASPGPPTTKKLRSSFFHPRPSLAGHPQKSLTSAPLRAVAFPRFPRQRRLPGLPSSRLGLEIMTGDVDRFSFESYLDRPDERPEAPRGDLHGIMENRLGLNKKPGYGPGSKR